MTDINVTNVSDSVVGNTDATAAAATSGAVANSAVTGGDGVGDRQRFKDRDEREKQERIDALEAEKQRHEQQMREMTIGAADGETATDAGVRQVEAFNAGYSARGKASDNTRDDVEIDYDDTTTVEQEDKHNTRRDVSRQRSHQARRTRVVQGKIEMDEMIRQAKRDAQAHEREQRQAGVPKRDITPAPEPDFEMEF